MFNKSKFVFLKTRHKLILSGLLLTVTVHNSAQLFLSECPRYIFVELWLCTFATNEKVTEHSIVVKIMNFRATLTGSKPWLWYLQVVGLREVTWALRESFFIQLCEGKWWVGYERTQPSVRHKVKSYKSVNCLTS